MIVMIERYPYRVWRRSHFHSECFPFLSSQMRLGSL